MDEVKKENEEVKKKVCFRCRRFKGYYTKELSHFERTKQGYCSEHEKIVENSGNCECWQNNYRRNNTSKKTSMKVLTGLLTELTAVRQILQEAEDEDKD